MGKFETPETEAAFDYIKKELLSHIDGGVNCSIMESLGLQKSDIPPNDMRLFVALAMIQPTHSSTIKYILENTSTLTEFLFKFYHYVLTFKSLKEIMSDKDVVKLLKGLIE